MTDLRSILDDLVTACETSGVTQIPAGTDRPDLKNLRRVLNEATAALLEYGPVFTLETETGKTFKIWPDGRTEGFPPGVVINRIPILVAQAKDARR